MKYKIWIYGSPFSGKSYFADTFPKPYVINTDGNLQFYNNVDGKTVKSYQEFSKALQEFDSEKYDTLIIDVLDHVYDDAREEFLQQHGIEHETDFQNGKGFGKGWTMLRSQFWYLISKIANIDTNLVLISHEDEREEKGKFGIDFTIYRPASVPAKIHSKIAGLMHFVGRTYNENGKHKIDFTIDKSVPTNGHRLKIKENIINNNYNDFIKNLEEEK